MSFMVKAGGLVTLAFVGGAAAALAPPEFRDKAGDMAAAHGFRSDCVIKGNVSINSGERIYHVPGQKYYAATKIRSRYGERWFCSEADARAAGWRKARQ
jgi:hypothetical protein